MVGGGLAASFYLAAGGAVVLAQGSGGPSVAESIAQEVRSLFERCHSAVVKIEATDEHGKLCGTGFFVDPNGTLFTSYTVGGASHDLVVSFGGSKYPARRMVADSRSGVAILKVETETPFLSVSAARDLELASPVVTIGYSMGLPPSPSFGTVGGFHIEYLGRYFATTHIRANVPVQRGQGGAPLLNMRGEVVGILISSLDQGSACFALPIEAAEKVRKDFVHFGEVRPGWLGIDVRSLPQPIAGSTAGVHDVLESGPGRAAGLNPGDILLQVGARKVSAPEDVLDASFFLTADEPVTIRVARGGEQLEFNVAPAEHPALQRTADLHLGGGALVRPASPEARQ